MSRTNRAMAVGVAVLAALSVGSVMERHLPVPDDVLDRPHERAVALGQEVELRTQRVVVDDLSAGTSVADSFQQYGTTAHYLMVRVRFEATGEPVTLEATLQAADGRRYDRTTPFVQACGISQVGQEVACRAFFEVPADALEGATLRVGASAGQSDEVAVVDLGIDQARAAELASSTQKLTVRED